MHDRHNRIKLRGDRVSVMLWQENLRRLIYAATMIFAVLFIGSIGYVVLENWTFFDSLYMTIITIATVGFHEVGHLSDHGRAFTMILIVLGIGTGGYSIGTIAAILVEGQMLDILRGRRMVKEITGLRDHVIVCGFGKIGRQVCRCLAEADQPFIVIDINDQKIDMALELGYLAAVGDATEDEILTKSGIKYARGLVSAISEESANIYLVLTARALNDKLYIIARGIGDAYKLKMKRAGANRVVSPYEIGAKRMSALLLRPEIVDFLEAFSPVTSYGLRLERLQLSDSSSLEGKRLDRSYIKRDTKGALVLGIDKPGQNLLINPPGDTRLQAGDFLLAIGNDEQLGILQDMVK